MARPGVVRAIDLEKSGFSMPGPAESDAPLLDNHPIGDAGDADPGEVEQEYVQAWHRNRLGARVVPPLVRPLDMNTEVAEVDGMFGSHLIDTGIPRRTERFYREVGPSTGQVGADGNVYIPLGSPALDKMWELRNVLVFNTDPWTAGAAGALAAVFAGSFQVGFVHMSDVVTPGVGIPANLYFSREQECVYPGQQLYVVVHTPGAGVYCASATVLEYEHDKYLIRPVS